MGNDQGYSYPKPLSRYARLIKWLMWKLRIKRELAHWFKKSKLNQTPASYPWFYKAICRHKYDHEKISYRNRDVWILTPSKKEVQKTIFYLHGGAYLYNITPYHWRFLSRLCHLTQTRIVIPDYPLTPVSNCIEVYKFLESLYDELFDKDQSTDVTIMGDSAGGGLALGVAQRLRTKQSLQPSQIILLAPWLDITLQHPDVDSIEINDPMLDSVALIKAGEVYRGNLDPKDPRVSPIFGEMSSLGRISIFVSTHDLLWADCRELHRALLCQGVEHHYFEYSQLFHVWMLVVSLPESQHAMKQIIDLVLDDSLDSGSSEQRQGMTNESEPQARNREHMNA